DHRRFHRVEDDDRLALLGAADLLQAAGGHLGELVDVGAGPGPGGARGDAGHDLGVGDLDGAADRGDDRDRRLPAAADQAQVASVEVDVEVDGGAHVGTDGGGGEVDRADP